MARRKETVMPTTATRITPGPLRRSGRQRSCATLPGRTDQPLATSEQPSQDQLCLLSDLELRKLELTLTSIDQLCAWCLEHGSKGCPACTQRRRKVVRLHDEDGLSLTEIAEQMGLTVERAERLLEQERDRRETEGFRLSHLPNHRIRDLFLRRKKQDPDFSAARVAELAGLSCSSHVERELGLIATSDKVIDGVHYPGRIKTTIGVDNAEKLLRAMGLQARDIERVLDGQEL